MAVVSTVNFLTKALIINSLLRPGMSLMVIIAYAPMETRFSSSHTGHVVLVTLPALIFGFPYQSGAISVHTLRILETILCLKFGFAPSTALLLF